MGIPASLLYDLEAIPRDRQVTLLMRHSVRFPIVVPADTYVVGLTEEGVRLAEEFGALLAPQFRPGRLRSSPIGRCVATGEAIARGAGWEAPVKVDQRLSHPYIETAWDLVSNDRLNGNLPEPVQGALELLLDHSGQGDLFSSLPALDIMVTHDTVVGAVAGCLLRCPVTGQHWPDYLEGVFLWHAAGRVHVRWRGVETIFSRSYERVV